MEGEEVEYDFPIWFQREVFGVFFFSKWEALSSSSAFRKSSSKHLNRSHPLKSIPAGTTIFPSSPNFNTSKSQENFLSYLSFSESKWTLHCRVFFGRTYGTWGFAELPLRSQPAKQIKLPLLKACKICSDELQLSESPFLCYSNQTHKKIIYFRFLSRSVLESPSSINGEINGKGRAIRTDGGGGRRTKNRNRSFSL